MAEQEPEGKKKSDKKEYEPAHKVIVNLIETWLEEASDSSLLAIRALGSALNSMAIPEDEILEVKNQLAKILMENAVSESNTGAFRVVQDVAISFKIAHLE